MTARAENTSDRENSWFWQARIALLAAGLAIFAVTATTAQTQQSEGADTVRPASIHTGSCASPGELVFELRDLVVGPDSRGTLEFVGAEGASVVEGSETTVRSTTLPDLTAAPHLIAVFESEGSDTIIACGEIGGFTVSHDDDLAIGLRQQNGSGFGGVALLDSDDEDNEVDVDIYLARSVVESGA